jgi:hypothetical protein
MGSLSVMKAPSNYTQSKLLNGKTEALREQGFTRWMPRDLTQAAVEFCRYIGLLPVYSECSSEHLTRYLFWQPPQGAMVEVRSGRTRDQFEEFDRVNRTRNMQLLSLHINESNIYSAVWFSTNHLKTAKTFLKTYGITPARRNA